MKWIINWMLLFCFPLSVLAQQAMIARVNYHPGSIYPLDLVTLHVAEIVFSEEEVIENIQSGDRTAWAIDAGDSGSHRLFIKPITPDSETNMTVVTNLHTYYFKLHSFSNLPSGVKATWALHFVYPHVLGHQKMINKARSPSLYHWDYSFHGAQTIMPLHVFDDGEMTYFQLRKRQALPAFFAVAHRDGKESLVNFRREGDTIVIASVMPQFNLRMGQGDVVSIFNNRLIEKMA
jgi:type IV secretion system protein VirB9